MGIIWNEFRAVCENTEMAFHFDRRTVGGFLNGVAVRGLRITFRNCF